MNKSKIKSIIPGPDKEWNGKVLRKRTVALEDGTMGNITLFPDNDEIAEGQEIEFEVETNQYGTEIKIKRENKGGGFKAKAWTPEQIAQENAVKLTAAALQSGQLKVEDYKIFFGECKEFMIAQVKEGAEALPF